MSKQNASKFLDKLEKDPALQTEVSNSVKAEDRIAEIGKKYGLEFSQQDLEDALLEKWGRRRLKTVHTMVTFSQTPGF